MKTIVLVTGGFDPLHSGHIEYFRAAKSLGDMLLVGLNSDDWLTRKKGQPFMEYNERRTIVENLKMVDKTISFDDTDNTGRNAILETRKLYPDARIIFANGGDRTPLNVSEQSLNLPNLEFVFGVGGTDKINSSSAIIERREYRNWGYYKVLNNQKVYKIKELVVNPYERLSMQRHEKRNEHWYVLRGQCDVATENNLTSLLSNQTYTVKKNEWHQIQNNYAEPCHILEVQYGEECVESDIERK